MRKLIACLATVIAISGSAFGWGGIGHQTTVVVAERHLTGNAKANLASLFGYPLRDDASWMDAYRKAPEYAFTGSYHTMAMNHDYVYDPSWRMATGGDCVTGLEFVDYMLSNADALDISRDGYLLYSRMVFHIVGDMHCLSHCYVMPERNQWKCSFRGTEYKYHGFLDHITDLLFEGMSIDEIAEKIDTATPAQIREAQAGTFIEWAQDCCNRDKIALDVNPYGTRELDPETLEKLRPAVEEALRVGGYRLALLLNRYFDCAPKVWKDVSGELVGTVYRKGGDKGVIYKADAATRTATIVSAWISGEGLAWSTSETPELGGKAHTNGGGANNVAEILSSKQYAESAGTEWAFAQCAKLGEGWYLPARYELNDIFDAYYGLPSGTSSSMGPSKKNISPIADLSRKARFDESMKELGAEPLDSGGEGSGLWSSTLCKNGVEAWMCCFSPQVYTTHKSVLDTHFRVRCIKKTTLL